MNAFSDGEIQVEIKESVRGKNVFVIASTCPPVNQHYMELFIMLDAFKRASPAHITAVIPYYGYARQDRKVVLDVNCLHVEVNKGFCSSSILGSNGFAVVYSMKCSNDSLIPLYPKSSLIPASVAVETFSR